MINFLLKLFLIPGVIFLADVISNEINYSNPWQIIYTGLFLGVVLFAVDALLLKRLGSGVAAVIDAVGAGVVIYFSQYFYYVVSITVLGAALAAVLLGVSEYLTHRLILEGKHETGNQTAR